MKRSLILSALTLLPFFVSPALPDLPAGEPRLYVKSAVSCGTDRIELTLAHVNSKKFTLERNQNDLIQVTPRPEDLAISIQGNTLYLTGNFQPGEKYKIDISKAFSSTNGDTLARSAVIEHRIPQESQLLDFVSNGMIFPLHAKNFSFPLRARRINTCNVSLFRIYDHNALLFENSYTLSDISECIVDNKKVTLRHAEKAKGKLYFDNLDLNALIPDRKPGIYLIKTNREHDYFDYNHQKYMTFILTDMTAAADIDEANGTARIFVHSLSTGKPVNGAQVTLATKKHFTASAVTKNGIAEITLPPRAGDFLEQVLIRNGEDTLVFSLNAYNMISTGAEDGISKQNGLHAFVYAERNIVRPGETFHPAVFLKEYKDGSHKSVKNAPVRLMLFDPSSKLICSEQVTTDENGFASHAFTLPPTAPTGDYTVSCGLSEDKIFGSFDISAALFVPDRIKVDVRTAQEQVFSDLPLKFKASAHYYFGGKLPAAEWDFSLQYAGRFHPEHFNGWTVGPRNDCNPNFNDFRMRIKTENEESVSVTAPAFTKQCGSKEALFHPAVLCGTYSVTEPGARAVTAKATAVVHPTKAYIGLRDAKSADPVSKTIEYTLLPAVKGEKVQVNADEKISIQLEEIRWEYLLRRRGVYFLRDWEERRIPVAGVPREAPLKDGVSPLVFKNLKSGEYCLTVTSGAMKSVMTFWHSAGSAGTRTADPHKFTVETDKEIYRPGDIARLTFDVPENGHLYCTYGETSPEGSFSLPLEKGKRTVEIPIRKNLENGSWHAMLTLASGCNADIRREFSAVVLKVDQSAHKLVPSLKLPEIVKPGEKVRAGISLRTADGTPRRGIVHVFAVDDGILALTGFRVPDIFSAFYGPYVSNIQHIDLFGMIFPDLKLLPDGTVGGDGVSSVNKPLRAGKLLELAFRESAVFSLPPVRIPESGNAEVTLPVPAFTGSLRVMAVAVSEDAAGSFEKSVVVRDPVSVHVAAPVAVTPSDKFDISVQVMNHEARTVSLTVALRLPEQFDCENPADQSRQLVLKEKSSEWIRLTCKAKDLPGKGVITVTAKEKDGPEYADKAPVTVRPVSVYETKLETVLLRPGKEMTFGEGAMEKDRTITVSNGFAQAAELAFTFLNNYPYGCAEQTVSQAFPLLYADRLARAGFISQEAAATAREKLLPVYASLMTMMRYDGSFSMWPGASSAWDEASVYAAHFILEGMNRHLLPKDSSVKQKLLNYLSGLLNRTRENTRTIRACACYAIAVGGSSDFIPHARNLMPAGEQKYDYASLLAACAMIKGGYAEEGAEHLRNALQAGAHLAPNGLFSYSEAAGYGMLLALLTEHAPQTPEIPDIAIRLIRLIRDNDTVWGTTQDNAWALIGLISLGSELSGENAACVITANGKERTAAVKDTLKLSEVGPAKIRNTGATTLLIQKKALTPAPLVTSGTVILRREYLDADGNPVTNVKHGDLITVRLHIETPADMPTAVLCDILPAGLEIEDSRLVTRRAVLPLKKNKEQDSRLLHPACLEKRFDRLLFFGRVPAGRRYFDYKARAVSRGIFHQSPFTAEEMYNPLLRGRFYAPGSFTVE